MKDLISFAYDISFGMDDFISGGPKWAYSDTFDIEAKADNDIEAKSTPDLSARELTSVDRLMVRRLLEDRFHLKVHREPKQVQGFSLVIAENGRKLKPAKTSSTAPPDKPQEYAFGATLPKPQADGNRMRLTPGDMHAPQANMAWLTGYLQFQPEAEGHRINDKTGLTGNFDISLKWQPEKPHASESSKDDSELPSLFIALQQQLGLKLEHTSVSNDSIVIDDLRRPSEN